MSTHVEWTHAGQVAVEAVDSGEDICGAGTVDSPLAICLSLDDVMAIEGTHQELIDLGTKIVRAAAVHRVATKRAEHENALHHEPSEDDRRWCPECTPELVCEHPEEHEDTEFVTVCTKCLAAYDNGWRRLDTFIELSVEDVAGN